MYTFPTIPTTTQAPPQPSWLDRLLGNATKVTDFGKKVSTTVQSVQNVVNAYLPTQQGGAAVPTYQYNAPGATNSNAQPTAKGLSTGAKVGIAAAVVALFTGIAVAVTRGKKKSVNGLGDLNTAKTKAGKVKQRKAVFAKLAEEGSVYPKNKRGVRKPKAKTKKRKAKGRK